MSRSHRITLSGVDFVPHLSGALFAPDFEALLVADLHLEKGTSLARRGVHLPPYDTRESLLQLQAAIEETQPRRLIFLGDSFHDGGARERIDAADLALLRAITAVAETVWITGNHDPSPPQDVGGIIIEEMALGPVTLRHHPRMLRDGEAEISGHLHPAAAIHARSQRIRCRCFIADAQRLIMPAFGSYTGALNVRSEAFDGLFGDFHVWMIGEKAVHRFPAAQVR
ncbi:ligase-associated DNA damage response endonuclease PdeM [Aestuariivirga sp.]|uniref:ligase-associated DNA damage response endonuclease PdeM n=1 Tax=Aestuariivirga sp. TaxID=2650926 RepID=UPI0030187FD9